MYIKTAKGELVHASASNGKVSTREFADKAVPNGGPTHYGLVAGVDYGVENITGSVDNSVENAVKSRWQPRFSYLTFALGSLGNGTREIQTGLNKLGYGLEVDE